MSLQLGIVGLPNVGKSTLFNTLGQAEAAVASYPFTTIDPNVGVVEVPDERLETIADIVQPDRVVPTTIQFVDVAGLVKGASEGEGLGNQFLGHIRNVDAIAMVVRCFRDPEIPHVTEEIRPREDVETIDLELTLADLGTVERRLAKVRTEMRALPKEERKELEVLERLKEWLGAGKPAREFPLQAGEGHSLSDLNLLTLKPILYVANVGEEDLPDGGELAASVKEVAIEQETEALVICAELEAELMDWPADEAAVYRQELGVEGSGLERLIRAGYRLLNLITFFTITGGHEARAWSVQEGTSVVTAAGSIHSDMQRGFIRADVIHSDDLADVGSLAVAREKGLIRSEGRDYRVQDGDVIHVQFNV